MLTFSVRATFNIIATFSYFVVNSKPFINHTSSYTNSPFGLVLANNFTHLEFHSIVLLQLLFILNSNPLHIIVLCVSRVDCTVLSPEKFTGGT